MTNSFQNPLIASMVSHQSWLLSSTTAQTSKSFLFKSIKSFLQQIDPIRQIHQYHHVSLIHQIRKNHTIFHFLNFFYRTLTKNQASEALHLRWKSTRGLVKKWASQYLQMLVDLTNIRWQDPNNSSDNETRCLVQRGLVKKGASTEYLNAGSACLAFSFLSRKKKILTDITYFY